MRLLDPDILPHLAALLLLMLATLSLLLVHRTTRFPAWVPRGSQIPLRLLFLGTIFRFVDLTTRYHHPNPFESWPACGLYLVSALLFILLLLRHISPAERRWRANERTPNLREVFSATDDLIAIADWSGEFTEINHPEALEKLLGQPCESLLSLRDRLQLLSAGQTDTFASFGAVDPWQREIAFDGHFFLVATASVISPASEKIGTAVLFHDIREARLAAMALADRNRELAAANLQLEQQVQVETRLAHAEETVLLIDTVQRDLAERLSQTLALIREALSQPDSMASATPSVREAIVLSLRETYQSVRKTVQALKSRKDI